MLRRQGYLVKRSLNKGAGATSAAWQKRWIVLHGHTVYWYKGADSPKGQLQLSPGSKVVEYTGQDYPEGKHRAAAVLARPYAFVIRTPELTDGGGMGLMLQADGDEGHKAWLRALQSALPDGTERRHDEIAPRLTADEIDRNKTVLQKASIQGWMQKRAVHSTAERWAKRWVAMHNGTIFWFSGLPSMPSLLKLKGQTALTPGTRVYSLGPRPHTFAVATPEMERAGLNLALQAKDAATCSKWLDAVNAAVATLEKAPVAATPRAVGAAPGGAATEQSDRRTDGKEKSSFRKGAVATRESFLDPASKVKSEGF